MCARGGAIGFGGSTGTRDALKRGVADVESSGNEASTGHRAGVRGSGS
jgi:hypothetical protein